MRVFVDTSALCAVADAGDEYHDEAAATLRELVDAETLVTHNYVAVETVSLLYARHGRTGATTAGALLGVIETSWIDADLHTRAYEALLERGRDGPSFVDHVSFAVMDELRVARAFAYDEDFANRGYELVG